jgi:hypothetical protein
MANVLSSHFCFVRFPRFVGLPRFGPLLICIYMQITLSFLIDR